LDVHITEMNVQIQTGRGSVEERLREQADIYRDIVHACTEVRACRAVFTWWFTDRQSWIPEFTGNPDAPHLFDEAYRPKLAYDAVMDVLT
jgi:endo-1,4-beta-xylanase